MVDPVDAADGVDPVDAVDAVAPDEAAEPVGPGAQPEPGPVKPHQAPEGDTPVGDDPATATSTDAGIAAPEMPAGTAPAPGTDPTVRAVEVHDYAEPATERLHPLLVAAVLLVTAAVVAVLLLAAGHVVKL